MLTTEQKAMRKTGIGGSEIAAVVDESIFASEFDIWLMKTQGWVAEETEDMRRGSFLEDGIARWYAQRYGISEQAMHSPTTLRHRVHPWALCTSDRMVAVRGGQRERLVSIKSPRRGFDWGEAGTDRVRSEYLLQLQWEWAVHSSHGIDLEPEMHLAALVDGELSIYPVMADVELQAWLLDYAGEWWERHVVRGEMPSLNGSHHAKQWLRDRFPKDDDSERAATPTELGLMLRLELVEGDFDRASRSFDDLTNELRLSMGATSKLTAPNGYVTWRTDKRGQKSFRTKWTNKEKHHGK